MRPPSKRGMFQSAEGWEKGEGRLLQPSPAGPHPAAPGPLLPPPVICSTSWDRAGVDAAMAALLALGFSVFQHFYGENSCLYNTVFFF